MALNSASKVWNLGNNWVSEVKCDALGFFIEFRNKNKKTGTIFWVWNELWIKLEKRTKSYLKKVVFKFVRAVQSISCVRDYSWHVWAGEFQSSTWLSHRPVDSFSSVGEDLTTSSFYCGNKNIKSYRRGSCLLLNFYQGSFIELIPDTL